MRAHSDPIATADADPPHAAVMHIVQAYLDSLRNAPSAEDQRRLLRYACTGIRTLFRHEEEALRKCASPELRQRQRDHQRIIAGMEHLARAREWIDEGWRGLFLHAMDEVVILHFLGEAARSGRPPRN